MVFGRPNVWSSVNKQSRFLLHPVSLLIFQSHEHSQLTLFFLQTISRGYVLIIIPFWLFWWRNQIWLILDMKLITHHIKLLNWVESITFWRKWLRVDAPFHHVVLQSLSVILTVTSFSFLREHYFSLLLHIKHGRPIQVVLTFHVSLIFFQGLNFGYC